MRHWAELLATGIGLLFVGQAASAAGAAGGVPALCCWLVMTGALLWSSLRVDEAAARAEQAETWLRRDREAARADWFAARGGAR